MGGSMQGTVLSWKDSLTEHQTLILSLVQRDVKKPSNHLHHPLQHCLSQEDVSSIGTIGSTIVRINQTTFLYQKPSHGRSVGMPVQRREDVKHGLIPSNVCL